MQGQEQRGKGGVQGRMQVYTAHPTALALRGLHAGEQVWLGAAGGTPGHGVVGQVQPRQGHELRPRVCTGATNRQARQEQGVKFQHLGPTSGAAGLLGRVPASSSGLWPQAGIIIPEQQSLPNP